eukprot:TRINITY_DN6415_c0_g3_i1.p1 TRINITY_DN6415_c0_g3~~TRINITY_DN6415_c0_g3_i1.p1  ORF type:complete len:345 (-),score=10.36 TRINITY_DN6415_c0_g3_i1:796-1830(-)
MAARDVAIIFLLTWPLLYAFNQLGTAEARPLNSSTSGLFMLDRSGRKLLASCQYVSSFSQCTSGGSYPYSACCTGSSCIAYFNRCPNGFSCSASANRACCTDYNYYFFCPYTGSSCIASADENTNPVCGASDGYITYPDYPGCCQPLGNTCSNVHSQGGCVCDSSVGTVACCDQYTIAAGCSASGTPPSTSAPSNRTSPTPPSPQQTSSYYSPIPPASPRFTPAPPAPYYSTYHPAPSSTPVAGIVGGVVAGVVALIAVIAVVVFCVMRRKRTPADPLKAGGAGFQGESGEPPLKAGAAQYAGVGGGAPLKAGGAANYDNGHAGNGNWATPAGKLGPAPESGLK